MANVYWNRFHPYVMPNVHGCPVALVDNAIRNACIEFCEKSLLWKQESEKTDIVAGEERYGFSAPAGSKVTQTVFASINDQPLIMTSLDDLDALYSGWRELEQEVPMMYYMDTDSTIKLVGIPTKDISSALEVHVALKPTRESLFCPEFIFEDWAEVIAHGALLRLNSMAGKVWADPNLVSMHNQKFRAGIASAKSKSYKSYQRTAKSLQPKSFGEY